MESLNLKSNMIYVNCGREDFNNSKVATISPYLDEIGIIEQSGHDFIFPALCFSKLAYVSFVDVVL